MGRSRWTQRFSDDCRRIPILVKTRSHWEDDTWRCLSETHTGSASKNRPDHLENPAPQRSHCTSRHLSLRISQGNQKRSHEASQRYPGSNRRKFHYRTEGWPNCRSPRANHQNTDDKTKKSRRFYISAANCFRSLLKKTNVWRRTTPRDGSSGRGNSLLDEKWTFMAYSSVRQPWSSLTTPSRKKDCTTSGKQSRRKERKARLDKMWDRTWKCVSYLGVSNTPFQQPRECCIHAGIQIWTWNACAISFDDLDSLHARLSEQFSWDICLFQEGLKRTTTEHIPCEQYTLLKGPGEGRGAPMITLRPHIARTLMKWEATQHWVLPWNARHTSSYL